MLGNVAKSSEQFGATTFKEALPNEAYLVRGEAIYWSSTGENFAAG